MRRARVFDGVGADGRPYASRPRVRDTDRVLAYLENAPIVLAARGFDPDELDPSRGAKVPMTFHTDGEWIWAGSVAYYLREHEIPPEPGLVAHIAGHGFELPVVDARTRDTAVSVITGTPPGGRELEEEARAAREQAALRRLARRLGELDVDPAAYRVGEIDDDTWCLIREGGGWTVFWSERGARHNTTTFATADQAAAYLLGTLLIVPTRMHPTGPPPSPARPAGPAEPAGLDQPAAPAGDAGATGNAEPVGTDRPAGTEVRRSSRCPGSRR